MAGQRGRVEPGEWQLAARLWHLHARLLVSLALGLAVMIASFALPWRVPTRILTAWDIGAALYLALTYRTMAHATVSQIRRRAAIVDEGALAIPVLTTFAAVASLAAIIAELGHAPNSQGLSGWSEVALGMGTILLSWAFMHTIFALHYAHEFYGGGRDDRIGGLMFPGNEEPDYWDFLYFSVVIAMTSQVSDVQITSKSIRRLTTVHGIVSFFFNLTVLALTVNMVSNLVQVGR
jgi:uncharacterized membrane protein